MTNLLSSMKTALDMLTSAGRVHNEWQQKRRAEEDDAELPRVVKWMDEVEQKVRAEHNLHAYSPAFEDAEWWMSNLPAVPHRLILRSIVHRQKRKERIDKLWARGF